MVVMNNRNQQGRTQAMSADHAWRESTGTDEGLASIAVAVCMVNKAMTLLFATCELVSVRVV